MMDKQTEFPPNNWYYRSQPHGHAGTHGHGDISSQDAQHHQLCPPPLTAVSSPAGYDLGPSAVGGMPLPSPPPFHQPRQPPGPGQGPSGSVPPDQTHFPPYQYPFPGYGPRFAPYPPVAPPTGVLGQRIHGDPSLGPQPSPLDAAAGKKGTEAVGRRSATLGHIDQSVWGEECKVQEDNEWIKDWLSARRGSGSFNEAKEKQSRETTLSIPEAKELLRRAIQLTEQLASSENSMDADNCDEIRRSLSEIRRRLSPAVLQELQKKINRSHSKRERLRRCRQQVYKEDRERLEQRQQLHEQIDRDMQTVIQAEHQAKREAELKQAADETIGEVQRKQTEAKRCLDLLKAIQKLRQIRKDSWLQQGTASPASADDNFQQRLQHTESLVNRQLHTYQAEQKTLQVMLDFEQEESKEKRRDVEQRRLARQQRRCLQNTHRLLFGPETGSVSPGDPLFTFQQYYTAAEHSVQALISVRQGWDMYLAAGSGHPDRQPPLDWVTPCEPSSDTWHSALKSN